MLFGNSIILTGVLFPLLLLPLRNTATLLRVFLTIDFWDVKFNCKEIKFFCICAM